MKQITLTNYGTIKNSMYEEMSFDEFKKHFLKDAVENKFLYEESPSFLDDDNVFCRLYYYGNKCDGLNEHIFRFTSSNQPELYNFFNKYLVDIPNAINGNIPETINTDDIILYLSIKKEVLEDISYDKCYEEVLYKIADSNDKIKAKFNLLLKRMPFSLMIASMFTASMFLAGAPLIFCLPLMAMELILGEAIGVKLDLDQIKILAKARFDSEKISREAKLSETNNMLKALVSYSEKEQKKKEESSRIDDPIAKSFIEISEVVKGLSGEEKTLYANKVTCLIKEYVEGLEKIKNSSDTTVNKSKQINTLRTKISFSIETIKFSLLNNQTIGEELESSLNDMSLVIDNFNGVKTLNESLSNEMGTECNKVLIKK